MADFSNLSGVGASAYGSYAAGNEYSERVKKTIAGTGSDSTDEELMSACREFEAYFLEQVFKEMQKSVDAFKSDDSEISDALSITSSNSLVDYFKGQTLQKVMADTAKNQSTGLAQMLYENMRRTYGIAASKEGESGDFKETVTET
jgi:Rod binding domain-containing protein